MTSAGDKIYVANADSNTTSVINPIDDTNEQNITLGFSPYKIAADYYTHKIYVPNGDSNTVSVIDGNSTGTPYKKDLRDILHDIVVGFKSKSVCLISDIDLQSFCQSLHKDVIYRALMLIAKSI
jgi:YVTN family beta-propeller protein